MERWHGDAVSCRGGGAFLHNLRGPAARPYLGRLMSAGPADYRLMTGSGPTGIYTVRVSRAYPHWGMAVMDFLTFNQETGSGVLLSISDRDWREAQKAYEGHSCRDGFLRDDEPAVAVHSTPAACWPAIQRDGALKSWAVLKRERSDWEPAPIGLALGDPVDFREYIMLSSGSVSSELVVLSKQKGHILMDGDARYETGVRLYLDAGKIARDGRLVRDGCHLKVRERLPLDRYLIWAADWKGAGLPSAVSTPRIFTAAANRAFNRLFEDRGCSLPDSV